MEYSERLIGLPESRIQELLKDSFELKKIHKSELDEEYERLRHKLYFIKRLRNEREYIEPDPDKPGFVRLVIEVIDPEAEVEKEFPPSSNIGR